jgi:Zn-dependent M28 family amino/carboxypeptidase
MALKSMLLKMGALATAAIAFAGAAQAQAPAPDPVQLQTNAAALRDQALKGSAAYPFLRDLTTEVGERLAGSQQEHLAAQWAVARLKAMGFQNVHIESFPVPGWTRGEERAELISPSVQKLAVTSLGNAGATPPEGIEAPVALFHTYADMLAQPVGSLTGKIVVVTQPMVRAQDGSGYGALAVMRFLGAAEAQKRGAAAYLVRSLSTSDSRLPHTGATDFPPGVTPIPAGALSVPDAEQLDRLSADPSLTGKPLRMHLVLTPTFKPGATADTVVADVVGRERPDEVVLIGGHLDSWDLGTGAIDDGAGAAITTAAAKLILDMPHAPRRTVRLALFGAEEINFAGPAFAAARSAAEQSHYVIAAECDFGAEPVYGVALPGAAAKTPYGAMLAEAIAPLPAYVDRAPARGGGEDVSPLAPHVPLASLQQDGTHYFDIHHSADDTLDKVDAARMDKAVAAWVAFTYLAADSDVDFRAKPSSP